MGDGIKRPINQYLPGECEVMQGTIVLTYRGAEDFYVNQMPVDPQVQAKHDALRQRVMAAPERRYVDQRVCDAGVRPDIYEEFAGLEGHWAVEPGTSEELAVQNEPWNTPQVERFRSGSDIRVVDEPSIDDIE